MRSLVIVYADKNVDSSNAVLISKFDSPLVREDSA